MNTWYHKLIGIAGIIFGICNLVPSFAETRWYCVFCFVLLGVPEIILGVICAISKKAEMLRLQSWINFLFGCSILFLALSDFYVSKTVAAMNYIAVAGLIITGVIGLFGSTKKLKLTLVP